MATSPPYNQNYPSSALSPPSHNTPLAPVLKRRQTDMPTSAPSTKRRKASMLSTTSAMSHPLRQTSFPPETASGGKRQYSRSPSVDDSVSMISGVSKKRKRKSAAAEKRAEREATAEEEEDGHDDEASMAVQVASRTIEEKAKESNQKRMLVMHLDGLQFERYEAWRVSKLQDTVVRRIINQTLSQSAPASVILAVRTAAKIFAGELVGSAVRVQKEWIEATGERQTTLPDAEHDALAKGEKEIRRGPLQPEHLREARRRYRVEGDGGAAGHLNLHQVQAASGVERFGVKFGGKRMLK